jgi:hypothetical protein
MDVFTAFLIAEVESEVYMYGTTRRLQGPLGLSDDGSRLVCHVDGDLYGIRETPRPWNAMFTSWLESYGFEQSLVDLCFFTIWVGPLL